MPARVAPVLTLMLTLLLAWSCWRSCSGLRVLVVHSISYTCHFHLHVHLHHAVRRELIINVSVKLLFPMYIGDCRWQSTGKARIPGSFQFCFFVYLSLSIPLYSHFYEPAWSCRWPVVWWPLISWWLWRVCAGGRFSFHSWQLIDYNFCFHLTLSSPSKLLSSPL